MSTGPLEVTGLHAREGSMSWAVREPRLREIRGQQPCLLLLMKGPLLVEGPLLMSGPLLPSRWRRAPQAEEQPLLAWGPC